MSVSWLLLLALAAAVWYRRRARVVVRLAGGDVHLVRGQLPAGVLSDLRVVATLTPEARGRVEVHGRGSTLDVRTPGLTEGVGQRARNVLFLRRRDL